MKNKWNFKKILLLILCGMMVLTVGCTSGDDRTSNEDSNFKIGKWNFNFGLSEKYTIDEDKYYEIKGIKTINVSSVSTPVEFHAIEDSQEIRVHFHGTIKTNSNVLPELEVMQKGQDLSVEINRKNNISVGLQLEDLRLDIYLPKGNYDKLTVKTVSGKINIDEVDLKEFNVKSVSGRVNVESARTQNTFVYTVSGGIDISDFMGDLEAETVSGAIEVEYIQFQNDIDINTISGRVNLKLPEDANFELRTKTTSGRLDCDFPIKMTNSNKRTMEGIVGSDDHQINVKTVSGSIKIHD